MPWSNKNDKHPMNGPLPELSTDTYMVYQIEVPSDNPIDLNEPKVSFGIAGCNAVCVNEVITQEKVGLVVVTNGQHPNARVESLVRAADLGYWTSGPMRGCQPSVAYWPVMHEHSYKGIVEVVRACAYHWENDRSVMFMDVYGGAKAIVGASIAIGCLTNKHPCVILIDIMKKRESPQFLHDTMQKWYPVHSLPIAWYPREWKDYVLFTRLVNHRPNSYVFRNYHQMTVTPPPGTPRSNQEKILQRERRDVESFDTNVTPRPVDQPAELDPTTTSLPELIDPAPMLTPPGGGGDAQVDNLNPPPGPCTPPLLDVSPRSAAVGVRNHHGVWFSWGGNSWGRKPPPAGGWNPNKSMGANGRWRARSASPRDSASPRYGKPVSPRRCSSPRNGRSVSPRGCSSPRYGVWPIWKSGPTGLQAANSIAPSFGCVPPGDSEPCYRDGGSGVPLALPGSCFPTLGARSKKVDNPKEVFVDNLIDVSPRSQPSLSTSPSQPAAVLCSIEEVAAKMQLGVCVPRPLDTINELTAAAVHHHDDVASKTHGDGSSVREHPANAMEAAIVENVKNLDTFTAGTNALIEASASSSTQPICGTEGLPTSEDTNEETVSFADCYSFGYQSHFGSCASKWLGGINVDTAVVNPASAAVSTLFPPSHFDAQLPKCDWYPPKL